MQMVYATYSDKPIVTRKPLKTKRKQGKYCRELDNFMRQHSVKVYTNAADEVVVKVEEKR